MIRKKLLKKDTIVLLRKLIRGKTPFDKAMHLC